jgi:hypothetical protein
MWIGGESMWIGDESSRVRNELQNMGQNDPCRMRAGTARIKKRSVNMVEWFPSSRSGIIQMARTWLVEITPEKAEAWGIPTAVMTALGTLTQAAEMKLLQAQSNERTPIITQECKAAFESLTAHMRDMKRRYFLKPPLTDADLVRLLLPLANEASVIPDPKDHPGLEVIKWAPYTLGFRRFVEVDMGGAVSNHGVRVYYALTETGAEPASGPIQAVRLAGDAYVLSAPPKVVDDLPASFFTRRAKDVLVLPPEASGKTCWLAARFENEKGKQGPGGTVIHALVP